MAQTTLLELEESADAAYAGPSARRVVNQDNWQLIKDHPNSGEPLVGSRTVPSPVSTICARVDGTIL
jgi:hypothetical protein